MKMHIALPLLVISTTLLTACPTPTIRSDAEIQTERKKSTADREEALKKGDFKKAAELNLEIDRLTREAEEKAKLLASVNARKSWDERQQAEQAEKARQQGEQMHTIVQDAAAPVLIQREATAHGILR